MCTEVVDYVVNHTHSTLCTISLVALSLLRGVMFSLLWCVSPSAAVLEHHGKHAEVLADKFHLRFGQIAVPVHGPFGVRESLVPAHVLQIVDAAVKGVPVHEANERGFPFVPDHFHFVAVVEPARCAADTGAAAGGPRRRPRWNGRPVRRWRVLLIQLFQLLLGDLARFAGDSGVAQRGFERVSLRRRFVVLIIVAFAATAAAAAAVFFSFAAAAAAAATISPRVAAETDIFSQHLRRPPNDALRREARD